MKKLFYGLGAIAAVATPVVAVVSCGHKNEDKSVGFEVFKNVQQQLDGNVSPELMIIGGGASQPVTQFMLTLNHDQTVRLFKGVGLLKDGDSTEIASDWQTPTDADKLLPFQKAVEAFTTDYSSKISAYLLKEYQLFDAADATKDNVAPVTDESLHAEFHAEGFSFGPVDPSVGYVTTDNRNQGTGGYSYLAFKIKLDDTNFEGAFVGKNTLTGDEAKKFADTQDALKHAFQKLAEVRDLADLEAKLAASPTA